MRLSFLGAVLIAIAAFAAQPLPINDSMLMGHSGNGYWGRRHGLLAEKLVYVSPNTIHSSYWAVHLTCPDDHNLLEAVEISGLSFQQFVSPCSQSGEVRFNWEATLAFSNDSLVPDEDFNSVGLACQTYTIPMEGTTPRTLYSARVRPHPHASGEVWDFISHGLLSGQAFILRIVPHEDSGVYMPVATEDVQVRYSLNLDEETDFVDDGDTGLVWLSDTENFCGVAIHATWSAEYGHDRKVLVRGYSSQGALELSRWMLLPLSDRQTQGEVLLGLPANLLQDVLTVTLNPDSGYVSCCADSVVCFYCCSPR